MKDVTPIPKPTPRKKATGRKAIKPFSDQRLNQAEARRETVATVIKRDGRCMFLPIMAQYMGMSPGDLTSRFVGLPRCDSKPLTAHEPGHARNVGRIDPEQSMAMCWRHNGWLEDCKGEWRQNAEGAGLIRRANGDPIRKAGVF